MAKALLGHVVGADPRALAHLVAQNRQLRQRVEDLEGQMMRLQAENDALAAAADRELLTVPDEMQLA